MYGNNDHTLDFLRKIPYNIDIGNNFRGIFTEFHYRATASRAEGQSASERKARSYVPGFDSPASYMLNQIR